MEKTRVDLKTALNIVTTAMGKKKHAQAENLLNEILEQAPLLPIANFKMGLLKYYKKTTC
jgi:hypothetical protein